MYSLVMVMALSSGTAAPDCHWSSYGNGGWGYGGWGYGGCCDWGYGGCYYGCGYGGYYAGDYGGCYAGYQTAAPAYMVVTMPAGAKLTIDGYVSTQTSSLRHLVTPDLRPGQQFTYTLVAEMTQNGQVVQQSQKVTVRAGQTVPVSFTPATTTATAHR
jgi:uncharacterized protein (TIGR03000 family)